MPDIRGKVSLDASGWERGIAGVKRSLGQLGPALGAAFSVGAATSFARSIARLGGQISDGARDAQLSTDAFQAFAGVMQDAGVKADKTASVLGRFNATREEAVRTDGRAREAMAALGVSTDELTGSTETLLEAVARGYKETGDYAALVDLFGQENAPAMQEALERLGVEGFDNLTEAMKQAGRVMDEDFIGRLDDSEDRIQAFWQRTQIGVTEWAAHWWNAVKSIGAAMKQHFVDELISPLVPEGEEAPKPTTLREKIQANIDQGLDEMEARSAERRARREAREGQDQKRRRLVFEAGEREAGEREAREKAGRPAGAPRMVREAALRVDDLRRVGANALGSGRIGGQSKEDQIARATADAARNTAALVRLAEENRMNGGGGAIF